MSEWQGIWFHCLFSVMWIVWMVVWSCQGRMLCCWEEQCWEGPASASGSSKENNHGFITESRQWTGLHYVDDLDWKGLWLWIWTGCCVWCCCVLPCNECARAAKWDFGRRGREVKIETNGEWSSLRTMCLHASLPKNGLGNSDCDGLCTVSTVISVVDVDIPRHFCIVATFSYSREYCGWCISSVCYYVYVVYGIACGSRPGWAVQWTGVNATRTWKYDL